MSTGLQEAAPTSVKTDVSAPLYRFFLADAQTAARAGDEKRALECLGLALEFVPDLHRERALLEASGILARVGADAITLTITPIAKTSSASAIEIAEEPAVLERLTWEPVVFSGPPITGSPMVPVLPPPPSALNGGSARITPASTTPSGGRGLVAIVAIAAVIGGAVVMMRTGRVGVPGILPVAIVGTPVQQARAALSRGDGDGALARLESLGSDLGAGEAYLARGEAETLLLDSAGAARSFLEAAQRDPGDGILALQAADRLAELGRDTMAADAYLHAATPERTREETERIARAQERVGYHSRARRIRAGGLE